MNKIQKKIARGFTLIEILIVIGIIAILAAIVLVAVNPAKNFREAANTQRAANVNAILNAVGQYIVDKKGELPPGLGTGNFSDKTIGNGVNDIDDFEDFCEALVPEYIGGLPADPGLEDQTITEDDCDTGTTGYEMSLEDGHITITATSTVDVVTGDVVANDDDYISVTR